MLGSPTVDITNLNTTNLNDFDELRRKVKTSCSNIVKTAETSLKNYTNLKSVTIVPHAPRFDKKTNDPFGVKANLAVIANEYMGELVQMSIFSDRISLGSHDLLFKHDEIMSLFSDVRTGKYDGVHLYSARGKMGGT